MSKTNAGLITAVVSAVLLSAFGMSDSDTFNGSADAIKQNSDNFREHEKLEAHPVALNEFGHINEDLDTIIDELKTVKEQQIITNELLAKLLQ